MLNCTLHCLPSALLRVCCLLRTPHSQLLIWKLDGRCDPYDAGDIAEAQCSVGTAEQCDDGTTALPYKLTNSQGFSRRYYTNGWPTDRTFEEVEQGFMKEVCCTTPITTDTHELCTFRWSD